MKKSLLLIMLAAQCFTIDAKTIVYGDVKLTHLKPTKENTHWVRKKQVSPLYPVKLAKKGIAGCGIFKVVVNEKGKTDSVELIQSVPEKVIFRPSKKIIRKWDWVQTQGGEAKAEEKIIRLDYCLGGNSVEEAEAICLKQSQYNCSAS
ncbi:energy transducer TonB [Pseudoalteromonas sp. G4]|uniref:energy transducer TonB n=1 Tax=Pseudoalteromonas sp. G4 TaxID=2992761 RepID=UPI00237E4CC9|nr:energy transducer TonB [Pseudoalteromonas sp. G4]MDE3272908.1 energy transducer TonB [Pseudoalteromonas sp. G4]